MWISKIVYWAIDVLKFFLKFVGTISVLQLILGPFLMLILFINGDSVSFSEVYGNVLIFSAIIYFSVISLSYYLFQEKFDKNNYKNILIIFYIISAITISVTNNRIKILDIVVINLSLFIGHYIQNKLN